MPLDLTTRGKVSLYTGAKIVPSNLSSLVVDPNVLEQWVIDTIERLDEIEQLRRDSIGDNLAVKVGTLELNFMQQYRMFFIEGRQLVNKLIDRLELIETQNYFSQFLPNNQPSIVSNSYW